jgi:thioredoxin 1
MSHEYLPESVTREEVDALQGATVLQFGTNWCGYCRAAQSVIEPVLGEAADLRRIIVEDGKGRPLGRSYHVKLWPTLVFLADGEEVARVVRPWKRDDVSEALTQLNAALSQSAS